MHVNVELSEIINKIKINAIINAILPDIYEYAFMLTLVRYIQIVKGKIQKKNNWESYFISQK